MKGFLVSLVFILGTNVVFAQNECAVFQVKLSADSVLMDNEFQVQFILENGKGADFKEPDFFQDFNVISGPNYATSMSIVNGEMSQEMTISYYLEPKQEGLFYIGPASIKVGDKVLETAPTEVLVVPNPDGIKQSPEMDSQQQRFGFGSPFEFNDPFFDIPHRMTPPGKDSIPSKPIKKRKTIRI